MDPQVRTLTAGMFLLAVVGTGSVAQEGSCVSALEQRIKAYQAVTDTMPRADADCNELREKLDALVAAELALRKSDRAVRRACPAGGEYVRGDSDGLVRSQFILQVARKRLANCPDAGRK